MRLHPAHEDPKKLPATRSGVSVATISKMSQQFPKVATTITSLTKSPLTFFLLVFVLSLPFWLAGAFTTLQLLPGLPVSSLMCFCPVTAALILVYRENKTTGVTELLKRSFDYRRIKTKIWYAPIIFLMPGVMVFSYGLKRLMGVALPTPQFTVLAALALLIVFFISRSG